MDAMPGPKFNEERTQKSWFSRNSQKIVLYLIIALLAIGGYYFYRNYQYRQSILRPVLENNQQANVTPPASPAITTAKPSMPGQNINTVALPEIKRENSQITARAAKGNGATHLARHALKEYLKDKTNNLGPEQKIYIEDYLQKNVAHSDSLSIGDQLTFSDALINEAIDQAQKLTDKQIQNLHKYVLLTPSL